MVSILFPSGVTQYSMEGNRERYIYALPSKYMVLKLTEGAVCRDIPSGRRSKGKKG